MKAILDLFAPRTLASVIALLAFALPAGFASTGQLWSFGENQDGQLADGTTTNRSAPAQVASDVAMVAAGGDATAGSHTFYLQSDGALWGVGDNSYGQLGDGTTTTRLDPVQVATGVRAVSAGIGHTLFVKTDGTLWALGFNQYGQLGDGTTTNRSTPVQVATGVYTVSAGGNHSLFLKLDGTVWAMGYNSFGQIGNNTRPTNALSPVQIASAAMAVATGGSHSLVLKQDGSLWVAGWNASGQLGTGPASSYLTSLTQLTTGVTAIAAGNQHSLYLKTDATLWAMGQNLFGQLGDGTAPTNQKLPVHVSAGVSAIATGVSSSYFLKPDGTLWAMGLNNAGQLGDTTTTDRSTPVLVAAEVLSAAGGPKAGYFLKAPGLTTQLDTWVPYASTPANNFNCLIYADGRFVAGSSGTAPNGGITMVSGDGMLWSDSGTGALPGLDVTGLAFGASVYVAVGANESGGGGATATSIDGLVWTAPASAAQPLRAVTFGNNLFVAVGDAGLIRTSPDGITWTTRTSGTANALRGVAYGGGVYAAVGTSGTVLSSTDGVTWTTRTAGSSGSANSLRAVAYGNGGFVAVGNGTLTSTDGATWTQTIAALGDGTTYHAVTYAIGQFVIAGVNSSAVGVVLHSPDGSAWTSHDPDVGVPIRGIAHGSNRFVIAGDSGTEFSYTAPVGSAPAVTVQPATQTVYAGNAVTFSVAAQGAPTLSYQWKKNNVAIAGATAATYTIALTDVADAGSYTAQVTNSSGNATSSAATLTVLKASQTITFPAIATHFYGDAPFLLAATAAPSGLPVTFSVLSGPASLSGSTVSITGVGTVTIRASQAGDSSYYAAPNVDRSFSVGRGTPVITWSTPAAITYGTTVGTTQLNATASLPGTFTYNPAVGTLLNAGAQTLNLTFTPTDSTHFNSVTAQQFLTVNQASASVTLANLSATYDGSAHAATASTNPGSLSVAITYNGSATVPVNAGSYAVAAAISDSNYTGSATGTLTIAKTGQSISFGALSDKYYGDPPFTLSASASPSSLPVSFSVVSGPATLSGSTVTLTGPGSVTLRATQSGNTNYNAAASVDRSFTVATTQPVITWSAPVSIGYGTALSATQLNATANVPGTFVYSPASGTVLDAGNHTLTATFTPTDTASYSVATSQQTLTVLKGTPVITWSTPSAIAFGTLLGSAQLNASVGSIPGSFSYSPPSGTAPSGGTQTLSVTFTPANPANYNTVSAQRNLVVTTSSTTVTLGNLNATYDGTAKTVTTTTGAGDLTVDITYNGSPTAPTNAGSYAIVATINSTNFTGSTTGTLTIAKADQAIAFSALADRAIGEAPFTLGATASPSGLPVTYTVLSGAATITGSSVALNAPGAVTIRASQAGDGNFNAAGNVDRTFTITKASAPITWPTPDPILIDTPLGSAQLNATSPLSGNFTYSPAFGTVLPLGTTTLTATFTPTDTSWYTVTTVQRTLLVILEAGTPVFSTQPVSQTVLTGSDVTMSVVVVGTPTPGLQWQKNGVNIPGATGSTLTLSRCTSTDTGVYTVVATNSVATVTSTSAALIIVPAITAPSNAVITITVE